MPPLTQPATPAATNHCPPTPRTVPEAVESAVESQTALREATRRLDVSLPTGADYRQIVTQYDRILGDATTDRDRCREEMRAFGAYLQQRGVAPEHIVTCVHQALGHVSLAGDVSARLPISREVVGWAIAGYYGTTT